jgi:hypothetical protein
MLLKISQRKIYEDKSKWKIDSMQRFTVVSKPIISNKSIQIIWIPSKICKVKWKPELNSTVSAMVETTEVFGQQKYCPLLFYFS